MSADGKHVYVAPGDRSREALAIFDRATDGRLAQHAVARVVCRRPACVGCAGARAARAPRDLVISRDGRNVYGPTTSGAIAVLDRDATNETRKQRRGRTGCVSRGARSFRRPARRVVDEHARRRSR